MSFKEYEKETRKVIGLMLKRYRQLRGLKQADLGKELGMTQAQISNAEKGKHGLTQIKIIEYFTTTYGVDESYFLKQDSEKREAATVGDGIGKVPLVPSSIPVTESYQYKELQNKNKIILEQNNYFKETIESQKKAHAIAISYIAKLVSDLRDLLSEEVENPPKTNKEIEKSKALKENALKQLDKIFELVNDNK